ncbi:MAG: hypothetical protein ACRDHY_03240, partial [Anaerolineales bacterium]
PAGAQAAAPPGFVGISPQSVPSEVDFDLMARAGVRSVRLPLYWSQVEPASPFLREPDWSSFDRGVELAARHDMTVLPFVWGTPDWLSPEPGIEPVGGLELRAWNSFLRRAVNRYGPWGEFWHDHSAIPSYPIRNWEIWNEPNIVTFGDPDPERFARLIRASGRTLKGIDRGAKLIIGGLFGRPLQVPPNIHSGDFLSRLYKARRVKRWFDGLALHPYVASANAMQAQIENLRRVMRRHNDAATPLYVTELGWGSDSFESRWERGLWGQAWQLDRSFSMLTSHRREWRIGGVWWFSWADADGVACQFCDSAGLLTTNREAKPSWYRFNAWTGGDPDTVPKAKFLE